MIYFLLWLLVGVICLIVDTIYNKIPWIYIAGVMSFPRENTLGIFLIGLIVLFWPVVPVSWITRWGK